MVCLLFIRIIGQNIFVYSFFLFFLSFLILNVHFFIINLLFLLLFTVSKKSDGKEFLSRSFKKQLESSSERSLNIEKLKTEETMERMSRDIYVLNDKLSMKKEGSVEYNHIAAKLNAARSELESLQKKNGKIAWEINVRETKKKMAF